MQLLLARFGVVLLVLNLIGCSSWQATRVPLSELEGRESGLPRKRVRKQWVNCKMLILWIRCLAHRGRIQEPPRHNQYQTQCLRNRYHGNWCCGETCPQHHSHIHSDASRVLLGIGLFRQGDSNSGGRIENFLRPCPTQKTRRGGRADPAFT